MTPTDVKPPSSETRLGGGSHLFSGNPFADPEVASRLGVLDADPGIRPRYRQWTDSAAAWEQIPEDGLPRHPGARGL